VDDCPVIDKWFTEYENLLTTLGIKDNNWACSLPIATPAYLHPHTGAAIKRMANRLVSEGKDAWHAQGLYTVISETDTSLSYSMWIILW